MGKLNLRDAYRIKGFSGEIERLKGRGFEWSKPAPPPPVITVTGSPLVTQFTRSGVQYTQILWRNNGSFTVPQSFDGGMYALVGGGGSGGRSTNTGTRSGGGGGSLPFIQAVPSTVQAGIYSVTIGVGGSGGASANSPGNPGDNSILTINGSPYQISLGGGRGGGNVSGSYEGGAGGNGGGGLGGTSVMAAGGLGATGGFPGGSGRLDAASAANRSGGGGGGAGGAGGNGQLGIGGNGGIGVGIGFTEPVLRVSGGGAGSAPVMGSAVDGGSSEQGVNAINGGGSSAFSGAGVAGAGGNGLFVLVFPSANATVAS